MSSSQGVARTRVHEAIVIRLPMLVVRQNHVDVQVIEFVGIQLDGYDGDHPHREDEQQCTKHFSRNNEDRSKKVLIVSQVFYDRGINTLGAEDLSVVSCCIIVQ